jgi:hypothetical protein
VCTYIHTYIHTYSLGLLELVAQLASAKLRIRRLEEESMQATFLKIPLCGDVI